MHHHGRNYSWHFHNNLAILCVPKPGLSHRNEMVEQFCLVSTKFEGLLQKTRASYMQALALQKQGNYNVDVPFTQFYLSMIHHSRLAASGDKINEASLGQLTKYEKGRTLEQNHYIFHSWCDKVQLIRYPYLAVMLCSKNSLWRCTQLQKWFQRMW